MRSVRRDEEGPRNVSSTDERSESESSQRSQMISVDGRGQGERAVEGERVTHVFGGIIGLIVKIRALQGRFQGGKGRGAAGG